MSRPQSRFTELSGSNVQGAIHAIINEKNSVVGAQPEMEGISEVLKDVVKQFGSRRKNGDHRR